MLPAEWAPTPGELSGESGNIVLITVHPGHIAPKALQFVNVVIAVGRDHADLIREYARVAGVPAPEIPDRQLASGEAFVWFRETGEINPRVVTEPPGEERNRHKRKYAEGQIEEDRVFYFRGSEEKLNLRVPNLMTFVQIAEGVDDDTWTFHLKQGDYSKWFRAAVKDPELADTVEAVERDETLPPAESRTRINSAIEEKYTAPA
jgi:hypothetical protein